MKIPCIVYRALGGMLEIETNYKTECISHPNELGLYMISGDRMEIFNPSDSSDWYAILDDYINGTDTDKFYFKYLMYAILRYDIDDTAFLQAINSICNKSPEAKRFILSGTAKLVLYCNPQKQKVFERIFQALGFPFESKIVPGWMESYASMCDVLSMIESKYKYGANDYKNPLYGLKKSNSSVFSFFNFLCCLYLNQDGVLPRNNLQIQHNDIIDFLDWTYGLKPSHNKEKIKLYYRFLPPSTRIEAFRKIFFEFGEQFARDVVKSSQLAVLHRTAFKLPIKVDISAELLFDAIDCYRNSGDFLLFNQVIDASIKKIGVRKKYYPITIYLSLFTENCPGRKTTKKIFSKTVDEVNKQIHYSLADDCQSAQHIAKQLGFGSSFPYSKYDISSSKEIYIKKEMIPEDIFLPVGKEQCEISELFTYWNMSMPKNRRICQGAISTYKVYKETGLNFLWCKNYPCLHSPYRYHSSGDEANMVDFMKQAGYDILESHENLGTVPNTAYLKFIDVIVKIPRIAAHLRCRDCGKILSPVTPKVSGGGYSRYACLNNGCKSYNKTIYINHCFNCDINVIDGRDSAKCPNGWYICPQCGSCCSNDIMERLKMPPPYNGHKEAGLHYCYKCGSILDDEGHCTNHNCSRSCTFNLP